VTVAHARTYRGVPIDRRRALRRERLIEAGLEEIGTRGYDNITVKDVCRHAGLTERYFYEHFADRAALLVAVFDEVVATVTAAAFTASDSAPRELEQRARAGLTGFLDALTEDPRRARVQLIEAVGRSAEQESRRFAAMHTFADYIATTADELAPRSDLDPRRRRVTALALVGGTNHLAVEWILGDLELSKSELVETLVALYVAAAHGPPPNTAS
jgi:AcrR family transcriptional regulator